MKEYKRSCCPKRSILEKILIVVIVLLICLLIALFAVFVWYLQNGKSDNLRYKTVSSSENLANFITPSPIIKSKESDICMSRQCVRAASQIIDFTDPTTDPCEDFYAFVCGKFLNTSSPRNELTPLSKFEAITLNQLDALIIEPIEDEATLPKSWQLQRKYYKMCMDTSSIESDNTATFSNLIKQLGDWPVLHGRYWDARKFNWLTSTLQCRKLGFGYEHFMGMSAITNGTGPILLTISPPVTIEVPYQLREFYIDVMSNISIELGAPVYLAKTEFVRVFQFEKEIKALAEDEHENGQEEIVTVSRLLGEFPSIPWVYFLNEITNTSVPFTENSLVRFKARRYLLNLFNLIERTPKSTQANYVVWKIIENFRSYLKESVRSRYDSFLIALSPNYAFLGNRHVFCLNKAKFYFPSVAELAYVRKYLQPSQREDIKKIAAKITSELIDRIKRSPWLDDNSKKQLLDTISQVEVLIGTSDQAYNGEFDEVVGLDNFELDTDSIMEVATKLYAKRADNYFKIVNRDPRAVTRETLQKTPVLSINAFYNEVFNILVVPAPFLQGVMYDVQRPQYMNYGSLGSIIGHELTHAFISNKNRTTSSQQWPAETVTKYEEKVQCLLDDYATYNDHLKDLTKDSELVLEENIADLLGPDLAYHAYQHRSRSLGDEAKLPSLSYTPRQMFWIMSATFRCYQPKLRQNVRFDQQHAVPSFAVTSIMRNSPSFAADFDCPIGSNMNPAKKCQIL